MSVSSIQRNILETQINYLGVVPKYSRSVSLLIDQITFTKESDTEFFTVVLNQSVDTPCILKCIRNGVITPMDIGNNNFIIDKIKTCRKKENAYHKVSKISYIVKFERSSGKSAFTFLDCKNVYCSDVKINLEQNKEKIWIDLNWDLTNALFGSERIEVIPHTSLVTLVSSNPIVELKEFEMECNKEDIEIECNENNIEIECSDDENTFDDYKRMGKKRRRQKETKRAWKRITGLGDIFWETYMENHVIVCGDDDPGYIHNLSTGVWKLHDNKTMISHVSTLAKPIIEKLLADLIQIKNKSQKNEMDIEQFSSIIKKFDTNWIQSCIYRDVVSKKRIVTTNIHLKINVQHLSQLELVPNTVREKSLLLNDQFNMSYLYPIKGNRVVNFITKTVRDRVPNDFFTFECPVNYVKQDGSQAYPNAMQFFSNICCGDMDLVRYHQTMLGYCLTGERSDESLYIHCGTGKSSIVILWKIMKKILSKFFVECQDTVLTEGLKGNSATPQLCSIVGKRVVLLSETQKLESLNLLGIKRMTDSGSLFLRQLHGHQFEYTSLSKVILIKDNNPVIDSEDNSTWDRVKIIPFNAQIQESESDYIESLLNKHLDEIFSFLVEGAHNYFVNSTKLIPLPQAIKTEMSNYTTMHNSILLFLDTYCEIQVRNSLNTCDNPEYMIEKNRLFKIYNLWCQNRLHPLPKQQDLCISFNKRFPLPSDRKNCVVYINKKHKSVYFGVRENSTTTKDLFNFQSVIQF